MYVLTKDYKVIQPWELSNMVWLKQIKGLSTLPKGMKTMN